MKADIESGESLFLRNRVFCVPTWQQVQANLPETSLIKAQIPLACKGTGITIQLPPTTPLLAPATLGSQISGGQTFALQQCSLGFHLEGVTCQMCQSALRSQTTVSTLGPPRSSRPPSGPLTFWSCATLLC